MPSGFNGVDGVALRDGKLACRPHLRHKLTG